MLGRISRGIGHRSSGKKGVKYRFDVVIEKLDNLPSAVKKCRVVWSRGPKLQMTEVRDVNKGAVAFKSKLSQIATMYPDAKGGFEAKEYKFQVQVPGKEDNKLLTVGRADLDMSQYVLAEGTAQSKMIPIMFKVGMASTGYLKVAITSEAVADGGDSDDGMTEVSGMTGMTANLGEDQDLSGFDEDRSAQASPGPQSGAGSRPSSRLSTAALSPRKPEAKPAAAAPAAAAAATVAPVSAVAASKPVIKASKAVDADVEISPMSLSPNDSQPTSPRESNSSKSARAAGRPSIVSKAVPAADARAQLFGTSSSTAAKSAVSSTSLSSSRTGPDLTEDEARAALFGVSSTPKRSSTTAQATASSSKAVQGLSDPAKPSSTKAVASTAAAAAVPASAAAAGSLTTGRRGLLDRSAQQDRQQAQAAPSTSDAGPGPSSIKQQPPGSTHGHSLSDSDDGSMVEQPPQRAGSKTAQATAQAVAASRIKPPPQPPQQQQQPPQGPADPSSAAAKGLSLENEKLKAQVVALRQQATEAEESRRMAVLAADNAASERDEYRSQVQELQEQLKEALVATAEETEQLHQELQQLKDNLAEQQQQHEDLKQQLTAQQETIQQHAAAAAAWKAERVQLQQQVQQAEAAADQAREHAATQLQQLQADAASHEGIVRHLSWQLEAAQQALQAQKQAENQDQHQADAPAHASSSSGGSALAPTLAQQLADAQAKASNAERQCATVLELLADEANALSQHGLVHQCITDQLLEAAVAIVATRGIDGAVQGPVMEVVVSLKAAAAALERQEALLAATKDSVQQLNAAVTDAQLSAGAFRQQHADVVADNLMLQEELKKLQQQSEQLIAQAAQWAMPLQEGGRQALSGTACVTTSNTSDTSTGAPPAPASPTAEAAACKVCGDLRQQLSTAQHKVSRLTAARDKLEIILHDLETSTAEERHQLEHQLSAANQALRSTAQQLSAVQQQLTRTQQEAADLREELQAVKQQAADSASKVLQADTASETAAVSVTAPAPSSLANSTSQQVGSGTAAAGAGLTQAFLEAPVAPVLGSMSPAPAARLPALTNQNTTPVLQVIVLAESAGPSGVEQALSAAQEQVADLQRQLAEAEAVRRRLDKDLATARKQLADEQSERNTLEEHMMGRLEDVGDDVAQETVAAYEVKYNRLKTRYRELTELHREEVDKLHDEIAALQERVVELEALAAQLEADKAQAQHGEVTLADTLAKASKASSELATLRSEHQMMMQALVTAKLELAQCSEREVIGRHELYKARETNLKLASKMTKLETLVYANKK